MANIMASYIYNIQAENKGKNLVPINLQTSEEKRSQHISKNGIRK